MRWEVRLLAVCGLLVCLAGLFVWYDTVTYDPTMNAYPGNDQIGANPDAYVGESVSVSGTVVATDPIVVDTTPGVPDRGEIILENTEETAEVGQQASAFGTLTDPETLQTERLLVRWPWENQYMYAVSILAAFWMAGRIVTQWRFDREGLGFVPRGGQDG